MLTRTVQYLPKVGTVTHLQLNNENEIQEGIVFVGGFSSRTPGFFPDSRWPAQSHFRRFSQGLEIRLDGGPGWRCHDRQRASEELAALLTRSSATRWLMIAHSRGTHITATVHALLADQVRSRIFSIAMCPPGGVRLGLRLLPFREIQVIHQDGLELAMTYDPEQPVPWDVVLQSGWDPVVLPLRAGKYCITFLPQGRHVEPFVNVTSWRWQKIVEMYERHFRGK
jgi:hypothetical protein